MAAKAIPNLYLKWRAFRELVGLNRSDAVIAEKFFGSGEGPIKFSKLLRGDYGCANDIASYLADVINEAIAAHRRRTHIDGIASVQVRSADLAAPVYDFTRKVIEAAEIIDSETLDRTHAALLQEMMLPHARLDQESRLRVEQYQRDRMFTGFEPSGGEKPVVFKPDKHLGRLAVEGLTRQPLAAYVLITRDPTMPARRLWEMDWGETVMWLPCPFVPKLEGQDYLLMPQPQPVKNVPGQFTVMAALLFDPASVQSLDPRVVPTQPKALDEIETARFLTNLRRMTDTRQKGKYNRKDIVVVSNTYVVEA